jgi:hypothetical protein
MAWFRLTHHAEMAELAFANQTFGADARIVSDCRADS